MSLKRRIEKLESVAGPSYQAIYDDLSALSDEELEAHCLELVRAVMQDPTFAARVERATASDFEDIDWSRDPSELTDEELEEQCVFFVWRVLRGQENASN